MFSGQSACKIKKPIKKECKANYAPGSRRDLKHCIQILQEECDLPCAQVRAEVKCPLRDSSLLLCVQQWICSSLRRHSLGQMKTETRYSQRLVYWLLVRHVGSSFLPQSHNCRNPLAAH